MVVPQAHPNLVTNPNEFRASPVGHVYGIVDDPPLDVPAVTAELLAAHIPLDGIHIYCCTEGLEALDPSGFRGGLLARIRRVVQSVAYDDDHLKIIESELEAGHALIGVAVDSARKRDVAGILRRQGGHDIIHYGSFTWERLSPRGTRPSPTTHPAPEHRGQPPAGSDEDDLSGAAPTTPEGTSELTHD